MHFLLHFSIACYASALWRLSVCACIRHTPVPYETDTSYMYMYRITKIFNVSSANDFTFSFSIPKTFPISFFRNSKAVTPIEGIRKLGDFNQPTVSQKR